MKSSRRTFPEYFKNIVKHALRALSYFSIKGNVLVIYFKFFVAMLVKRVL